MSIWSRVVSGEKDGVAGFVPATVPRDIVGTIELLAGFATVTRANGICIVLNLGDPVFQGDIVETAADSHITIRFIDDTALSLSASASVVLREFTNDQASPSALFDVARGTFAFSAGQVARAGRLSIETPVATIRGRMRSGGIGILSLSALFFAALEKAEAVSGSLNPDDGTIECRDMGQYGVVELVPHGRLQPQFLSACEVIHILANGSSEASPLSAVQLVQLQAQQQETLQLYRLGLQVPTLSGPGGSGTNPNFELLPARVKPINFVVPENNTVPQNSLGSSGGPNKMTISDTFIQIPPPPPPPPPGPVTPAPVPELPGVTGDPASHDTSGTLAFSSVSVGDPSFVWSNGSLSDPQLQNLRDASTLSLPPGSTDFTFSIPDNALDFLAAGETLTVIYNVTITDGNGNNLTQQIVIKAAGSEDIPIITTAATDNSLAELAGTNNESTHAVFGTVSFVDVDLTDRPKVTAPFASYSYLAADGTTALTLTAAQQSAVETALTISPDAGNANNGSAGWTYSVADHLLDFLAKDETLTLTYTGTVDDGHGGVVTTPITVTIHGTNDVPVIAAGTTATGEIHASGQGGTGATETADANVLVGDSALVNGLGGSAGFGENVLPANDDGSTGPLDITAIFGPSGLNFFGHNYTTLYVNNNGNVTFGSPLLSYTPAPIGTDLGFPIIAPFWGDVDTRAGSASPTPGGNSTGSDLVYYDFDTVNGVFTVTWDDVGFYSANTSKLDAFQLQLINHGGGDFDIVFRYEAINWTAGDASGGSNGLGGTAARAGYSAGDNDPNHTYELPESGIQADMLALPDTSSNTANPGVFEFHVRNGVVVSEQLTATGVIDFTDPDYTDTHTATFVAEGANYVGTFLLNPITQDSSNGATGQVGWSFSADDSAIAYLAAGESVVQQYDVTIDDGHGGTTTQTVAITITGTNDAPVITGESNPPHVTEAANASAQDIQAISGTVTVTDLDIGDSLTGSVTGNATALLNGGALPGGVDVSALIASGAVSFNTVTTNGGSRVLTWTYDPGAANLDWLKAGDALTINYTAQVNDGHGNVGSQALTITIDGTNDAPVVATGSAAVSEEGLPGGNPDDSTNSVTASGTIGASDADGDALTWTLGSPGPALTSGGQPVTWSGVGTGTLVGSVGATPILTVTIDNTGHYNVTLSGPIDHPDHTSEDVKTIGVPVNVYDGHTTATTALSVNIEDDIPKAALVSTTIAPTDSNTNVMLILDLSGSMAFPSGLPGLSRLDVEKAAVNELLDQYDSRGNVMVRLITFSGTANSHGSVWMSVADAKAAIAGLTAGGSTNYDAGLLTAMSAFAGDGKLPAGPATQNVSYFLSDGSPTSGSPWPQIPGDPAATGINGIEQNYWENFLTTNHIVSFAIGVGNGVTTTALNPIAFDPAPGTQLADTPIVVTDLSQLAATLVFSIPPISGAFVAGINGASNGSFGADGGHMQSITVDGVTYTFHPTTNTITTSGGGTPSYTYDSLTNTLTVDTDPSAVGGELAVVMTTGAFTFKPTQNFTSESVGYVLVDNDGDTAGNTVVISASGAVAPAGVAGEAINLGLTNPVGHGGAMNVSIAGLPAGWSLSEGTHNGDGSWTVQSNDVAALTVISPADYTGALALHVTESWTNADGSNALTVFTDNVEAYAPGNPIFAISGNDHLTGSSAADLFVFAQPIGVDIVHNFDIAHDQIDLIGYAGFASFADVQAHLANDGNGDAVLTLGDGQSITFAGVDAGLLTAADFAFDQEPVTSNTGSMVISDGALLPLSGIVNNSGTIALDSAGNGTELELIQHGITLQGGGTLTLSDSSANAIFGTGPDVLFTNVDNIISGAGQFGEGHMMLVNDGAIIATGITALEIDTGANAVVNAGTLEATGNGGLHILGDAVNDGLLWANGGDLAIDGNVSGNGSVLISAAAAVEFGGASAENVTFTNDVPDSFGRLVLDQATSYFGDIYNFTGTDGAQSNAIDLRDIAFDSGLTFAYHDNVGNDTGGTLTIFDTSDGAGTDAAIDSISFANGDYTTASFALSSDGQGGTLITSPSTLTTTIDATETSLSSGADATLTMGTDTVTLVDSTNQLLGTDVTVNNSDVITGGAGVDTLTIDSGNGVHAYTFGDGANGDIGLANFENLTLTDGNADGNNGDAVTVTFDSFFQNNGTLTVDGSALQNLTATNLTIDSHLARHDSFVFIGSANADALTGGSQNDTIIGGGGGDTLMGGGGSDTFVFKAVTDSQPSAGQFDTITDFTAGLDHIDLAAINGLNSNNQAVMFQSLTSVPSTLAAHTIDIVTMNGNTTIYANASTVAQSIGSVDMEIHLNNVTNVQLTDFILHH